MPLRIRVPRLEVIEATLDNGLRVRLLPDDSVPICSLYLVFRVGTRHERPGLVGISHLFEHMYFNGAKKYGYGDFDRVLEGLGGESNAYTTHDETVYHENFPSEALETVLDLEADRMRSLRISPPALERERRVVMEERRLRVDNDVSGMLGEELDALAYRVHPYGWPVVGRMEDIAGIRRADCNTFFDTYYAPNNATLYLAGDVTPAAALRAIRRAFQDIPRRPAPPAPFGTEPEPKGERRMVVRHPAQAPQVLVAYLGPPAGSEHTPALDVLQFALSVGESSRLVQKLIYERELAVNVSMDWTWRIDPGLISFSLDLEPESDPAKAEQALHELSLLPAKELLTPREMERAKNNLQAMGVSERATASARAAACATYESTLGSWREVERVQARYAAVTASQVREAARRYLRPERRTVVTLLPEAHR
jgi:zinc protease